MIRSFTNFISNNHVFVEFHLIVDYKLSAIL